jgi:hypothetical protein
MCAFGLRQFLFLERRVAEVAAEFRAARDDGGGRIRVRQGLRDLVEPGKLLVAPLFRHGHLQDARLHGDGHGGQGDAVLVREVRNGLHLGIVADQVVREIAQRGHAAHVLPALGAVPDGQQRPHACAGDIDIAGQQSVVDGRAAGQVIHSTLMSTPCCLPCFSISFWSCAILSSRK